MKKCKWIALLLLGPLLLTSCADLFELGFLTDTTPEDQYNKYFDGIVPLRGEIRVEAADLSHLNLEYSERDMSTDYDKGAATRIVFADGGSTVYGHGAETDQKDVRIISAGTYIISGSASGALLTVNVGPQDEVRLVLSGLSLGGKDGTAIDIRSTGSVLLTLEGENFLSDFLEGKPSAFDKQTDAVILSRGDLTINGAGSLSVSGYRVHGIVTYGAFTLTGGTLNVYSASAGLVCERCVKIGGGELHIRAEEEGILSGTVFDENKASENEAVPSVPSGYIYVSDGFLDVVSTGDAIRAQSYLVIRGGALDLTTGVRIEDVVEEEEVEETLPDFWDIFELEDNEEKVSDKGAFIVFSDGLSASSDILITGGTIKVNASNHAICSQGKICIDGGRLYICAVHGGLCAGSAIGISDGAVILQESRVGLEGESVDISGGYVYVGQTNCGLKTKGAFGLSGGVFTVAGAKESPLEFGVATATGGVLVALGNAKVAREFFPSWKQGVILCHFGSQGDGYPLSLCDNEGNTILSLEGKGDYSCAYLSSGDIGMGDAYTLMSGGFVMDSDLYGFAMNAKAPIAAEPLAVVTANS